MMASKAKQIKCCEHPHTHHMSQDAPVDLWQEDASSGRRPQQPNTTPKVKHSVITNNRMHSPMEPQYLHHTTTPHISATLIMTILSFI